MTKNAGAIVAGFLIWVVVSLTISFISVFIWEHSPDRYASIAFQCWIGTSLALPVAYFVKVRTGSQMMERTFFIVLGGIILLWAATSMISGVDVDFKLVGIAAHALAIGIAVWRSGHSQPIS